MDIKKKILFRSILAGFVIFVFSLGVLSFLTWAPTAILVAVGLGGIGMALGWMRANKALPQVVEESRATFEKPYDANAFSVNTPATKSWERLPKVADLYKIAIATFSSILITLHQKQQIELIKMLRDLYFPVLGDIENKYQHFAGYYSQRRLVEFLMNRLPGFKKAVEVACEGDRWEDVRELFLNVFSELALHYDQTAREDLHTLYGAKIETGESTADVRETIAPKAEVLTASQKASFSKQLATLEKLMGAMMNSADQDIVTGCDNLMIGTDDAFVADGQLVMITERSFLTSDDSADAHGRIIKRYFMKGYNLVEQDACLFRVNIYDNLPRVYLGKEILPGEVVNTSTGGSLNNHDVFVSTRWGKQAVDYKGQVFPFDSGREAYRSYSSPDSKGDYILWIVFKQGAHRIDLIDEQGVVEAQFYTELLADTVNFFDLNPKK